MISRDIDLLVENKPAWEFPVAHQQLYKPQYVHFPNQPLHTPSHSRKESCATILFSSFHACATYLFQSKALAKTSLFSTIHNSPEKYHSLCMTPPRDQLIFLVKERNRCKSQRFPEPVTGSLSEDLVPYFTSGADVGYVQICGDAGGEEAFGCDG